MKLPTVCLDRGMLSVSRVLSIQLSLSVNCFGLLDALRSVSSVERKILLDLCTGRFKSLVKKRLVFTVLLKLFSARIRREDEERSSPERGRNRTPGLDFTNVCWQRNNGACTMLFYFKVTFGSRWPVEVPKSRRVWLTFLMFFPRKQRCI